MSRTAKWRSVPCPTCGVFEDERCRRSVGTEETYEAFVFVMAPIEKPHVARVRAAAVLVGCLPPMGG